MEQKICVVRPKRIDDLLVNPGIGFMTFQRFNGDELNPGTERWTEGHPIEYQPDTGRRSHPDHPDTSLAYFRVYWKYFEPEKRGEYNWEMLDKALATARERGQTLLFRLAPHGSEKKLDVPPWYRQLVGPKTDFAELKWLVDPNDPRYAECFGETIRAIGARYDGHPDLESVDMALMSAWGECEHAEWLTPEALEALVSAYTDSFTKTPLLMLLNNPQMSEAIRKRGARVGFRADCLGDMNGSVPQIVDSLWSESELWSHMIDVYPRLIIETGMQDAWKHSPISFEICWVLWQWQRQGWDLDYIIEQSLKWHISSFNAKSSPVPPTMRAKIDGWLKKMGYRLSIRRFTYPEMIAPGGQIPFTCWIENTGVAPCYKPFRFALRVKNAQGEQVHATDAKPIEWLPGDSLLTGSFALDKKLGVGHYDIQAAIIGQGDHTPVVRLATEGREPDGWYTMGRIRVEEEVAG